MHTTTITKTDLFREAAALWGEPLPRMTAESLDAFYGALANAAQRQGPDSLAAARQTLFQAHDIDALFEAATEVAQTARSLSRHPAFKAIALERLALLIAACALDELETPDHATAEEPHSTIWIKE